MSEQQSVPTPGQQAFAQFVVEGNAALVQGISNLNTALEPVVNAFQGDMANMAHAMRIAE